MVKNLPANAGDLRGMGYIPGLGRSPGGGHGSLLQYSCLENPMDRGAWWATVHQVAKSRTLLKQHNIIKLSVQMYKSGQKVYISSCTVVFHFKIYK